MEWVKLIDVLCLMDAKGDRYSMVLSPSSCGHEKRQGRITALLHSVVNVHKGIPDLCVAIVTSIFTI